MLHPCWTISQSPYIRSLIRGGGKGHGGISGNQGSMLLSKSLSSSPFLLFLCPRVHDIAGFALIPTLAVVHCQGDEAGR